MADDKDDEKKKLRTNAAPELHPPGVARRGYAPPGMVGNDQAKGNIVSGPYYMVDLTPDEVERMYGRSSNSRETPKKEDTRTRFHQTGDDEVDRFYAQDHRMIADENLKQDQGEQQERERDPELDELLADERREPPGERVRDPELDEMFAQEKSEDRKTERERDPELDRMLSGEDDRSRESEPDTDRYYARDAQEQGRDDERLDRGRGR